MQRSILTLLVACTSLFVANCSSKQVGSSTLDHKDPSDTAQLSEDSDRTLNMNWAQRTSQYLDTLVVNLSEKLQKDPSTLSEAEFDDIATQLKDIASVINHVVVDDPNKGAAGELKKEIKIEDLLAVKENLNDLAAGMEDAIDHLRQYASANSQQKPSIGRTIKNSFKVALGSAQELASIFKGWLVPENVEFGTAPGKNACSSKLEKGEWCYRDGQVEHKFTINETQDTFYAEARCINVPGWHAPSSSLLISLGKQIIDPKINRVFGQKLSEDPVVWTNGQMPQRSLTGGHYPNCDQVYSGTLTAEEVNLSEGTSQTIETNRFLRKASRSARANECDYKFDYNYEVKTKHYVLCTTEINVP